MNTVLRAATRRGWVVLAGTTLALSAPAAAAPKYVVAPPAPWVDPAPLPEQPKIPTDTVGSGVYYILVDEQTRVGERALEAYHRTAEKVLTSSGVQNASEISIEFDPSFERLTLHHVVLVRGGRRIDALRTADVNVIQQESELEERLYNGTFTALVFLHDVRAGDVIDYAYTRTGSNPILEGRYADSFSLGYSTPVGRVRQRLVWPAGRALYLKDHGTSVAPEVTEGLGTRTYVWDLHDVPAVSEDDDVPEWYDPYPWVQVTEYAGWADVARWADEMYSRQARPSATIRELVDAWSKDEPDLASRIVRAIRFVQDEVRYLGIEVGPSSHRPHAPAQILEQRFGDCKDKALLLVTLLRAMGVEAEPALVHSERGRGLDGWLPSPFAFDHVIVRLRHEGREHWVDATVSEQGGRLGHIEVPDYAHALPVRPDTTGLVPMTRSDSKEPTRVVRESYTVGAGPAPASLLVETTYRGSEADQMRRSLATTAPAEIAKAYLNHYARSDPEVRAVRAPTFHDDREGNVVTSRETYALPHFWRDGKRELYPWSIGDRVERPQTAVRTMPLAVPFPVHAQHVVRVSLPRGVSIAEERESLEDEARRFRFRSERQGQSVLLTYEYSSLKDFVSSDRTARDLELVDRIQGQLTYTLHPDGRGLVPSGTDGRKAAWSIGFLAATLASWWSTRAVVRLWRGGRTAREARWSRGTTADTALVVRSAQELEGCVASLRCACGGRTWQPRVDRVPLTYEGEPMTVISRHCIRCGREQTLYVRGLPSRDPAAGPS